jgi:hypothetical protein
MLRHAVATRRDLVNIHATAPSAPPSYGPVSNHAKATRRISANIHATSRQDRGDPEDTPRLCTPAECSSLLRQHRAASRRRTCSPSVEFHARGMLPRGSDGGTATSAPPPYLCADEISNIDSALLLISFAFTPRLYTSDECSTLLPLPPSLPPSLPLSLSPLSFSSCGSVGRDGLGTTIKFPRQAPQPNPPSGCVLILYREDSILARAQL